MRLSRRPATAEKNGRRRKRVVILGGGLAGVYTARYLEKALGRRDDSEVVLVNKAHYFVFQPMLAEVVSGAIGLTDAIARRLNTRPRKRLSFRTPLECFNES